MLFDQVGMRVDDRGELLLEPQADRAHVLEEALVEDDVEHGDADRHRERIAAEGRAVRARRHAGRRLARRKAGADREAGAKALRERRDVGRDARPFVREEAAGAAHAGLDLVEDQEQAALVAEPAQVAQVLQRHRADAALALDRLDQDRRGLRPDRRLERLAVAERHLVEALDLRAEAFEIFRLAAGGDRRERAAVEGALEGDDAEALRRAVRRSDSAAPS